jgi:pyochelin synthetase
LEGPTVAQLAVVLATSGGEERELGTIAEDSPLVWLATGDGPVRVLMHDATGTLAKYEAVVAELTRHGPLVGIAVPTPEAYLALDPALLVERLAGDYARLLLSKGCSRVHLIGYEFGGLLVIEIARYFAEVGADVESLSIIGVGSIADSGTVSCGVVAHSHQAAAMHLPVPYVGDIMLLRPLEAADEFDEKAAFWRDICLGDVRVVDVPGDRETCFRLPHVRVLAEVLISASSTGGSVR